MKKYKSEKRFKIHFSFDSSQLDIYMISLDREKLGLLIDISYVYVPYLVREISPYH